MTEAAKHGVVPWSFIGDVAHECGHEMLMWPRKVIGDLRYAMAQAGLNNETLYSACFYIPGAGWKLLASTRVFDLGTGAPAVTTLPAMLNAVPSSITGKTTLKVVA